eukprot:gb/GECH01001553.1/.p1 GENE.gb/GECH01001553.1/~~gb/GECH01001553.1/.p1  ORF type:complete len:424 (+),score=90.08 gb/GECH01001553.1/:1-1272(+)
MSQVQQNVPHKVSLKVMRLSRPDFAQVWPVVIEETDIIGPENNQHARRNQQPHNNDVTIDRSDPNNLPLHALGFTEKYKLPLDPGTIHIGETFRAYVSVNNNSFGVLKDVAISATIKSPSQPETVIVDMTDSPMPRLEAGNNHDIVIEHPLTERGEHKLVCTVEYKDFEVPSGVLGNSTPRRLSKSFKFHPATALSLRSIWTRYIGGKAFIQFDLQNVQSVPLYVQSVRFCPVKGMTVNDQSTHNTGPSYTHQMSPHEQRRFLFELQPTNDRTKSDIEMEREVALGKVDVRWRIAGGASGALISPSISYKKSKPTASFEAKVIGMDENIRAQHSFCIQLQLRNNTEKTAYLSLQMKLEDPIVPDGPSQVRVGEINAGDTRSIRLPLIALDPGVHPVRGLAALDQSSNTKTYLDTICHVKITSP